MNQVRFRGLVCLLTIVFACPAGHAQENAATVYRRAFEALPPREQLPGEQATPEEVDAYLKASEAALRLLHEAAAAKACDWGDLASHKAQGPLAGGDLAQRGVRGRQLLDTAQLRARRRFQHGKQKEAIDDLMATLVLCRRYPANSGVITHLMGNDWERTTLELAATILGQVDAPTVREFRKRYEALPQPIPLADALKFERDWQLAWFPTAGLLPAEQKTEFEKLSAESMRIAALPPKDVEAECQKFQTRLDALPAEWKVLTIGLNPQKFCKADAQLTVTRALFQAGLAILIEGPDALQKSRDPFGTGPFSQRTLPRGFELTSALKRPNGDGVKLIFGKSEE